MTLNTDLNILYFGGSGGFYLLHYILLAGQHWCHFQADTDFATVFERQWNITELTSWKRTECWPNNAQTQNNPGPTPYKIFFSCNNVDQWQSLPGRKILLYTDIQSQIRLSRAKKTQYASTRMKALLKKSQTFLGHQVLSEVASVAHLADHTVYLQDLVLDPESVLGISPNSQQQQFTQHWLALHPEKLLRKINL